MKLKELVDVNSTWSERAVGSSALLGVCFLVVASLHYMKVDQTLSLDFGGFILFMIASVLVLLCFLLFSLFMMSETTKSIIMSHRVLSQIVENSESRFVKLYLLDINGHPVLPALEQHERYDLIDMYGEELERIRGKLYRRLVSLMGDQGAQQQCQASYDKVAELETWKLKDRIKSESVPSDTHEVAETMFFAEAQT